MNGLENSPADPNAEKATVEKPAGAGPAGTDVDIAGEVEREVSAVDSGGTGSTGTAPVPFSRPKNPPGRPAKSDAERKYPRKRPLKNSTRPFSSPSDEAEAAAVVEVAGVLQPEQTAPPLSDEEYKECGECLAEIYLDFYDSKDESKLRELARLGAPQSLLDRFKSQLVPGERTKANLAKGFEEIARELNLSRRFVRGASFLNTLWSLHRMKKAQWAAMDIAAASLRAEPERQAA